MIDGVHWISNPKDLHTSLPAQNVDHILSQVYSSYFGSSNYILWPTYMIFIAKRDVGFTTVEGFLHSVNLLHILMHELQTNSEQEIDHA